MNMVVDDANLTIMGAVTEISNKSQIKPSHLSIYFTNFL